MVITVAAAPIVVQTLQDYQSARIFCFLDPYADPQGACYQLVQALNAVGSGDVVTNILNSFREDGPDFLAEHGKIAPIKRAAKHEEIAEVVAFLASDKASFMVGSIVMADGGISVIIK